MKRNIIKQIVLLACASFGVLLFMLFFLGQSDPNHSVFFLFLLALYVLILLVFVISFIHKRILLPIAIVISETKRISKGDLSHKIAYDYPDEIGELLTAFDDMRSALFQQQCKQEQFEVDRKAFIESISHDLKTPIASISAYTEALQDGIARNKEEEEAYLDVIQNKVRVLSALSKQLALTYSSPSSLSLQMEEVKCAPWAEAFLAHTVKECHALGKQITTSQVFAHPQTDCICLDIAQCNRALQNITDNAYCFSKQILSVEIQTDDKLFYIRFKNDGVSIKQAQLPDLFQRFYSNRSENSEGHLGLGLAIANTLITAMKGYIDVSLEQDVICFTVSFPLILNKGRSE